MLVQKSTVLLFSLPSFWALLSWFIGQPFLRNNEKLLERIAIAGSVALFFATLIGSFAFPASVSSAPLLLVLTPLRAAVIGTVVTIGVILIRYSRNYLAGEACYPVFLRWMKLVLAAVVVTLLANHLAIFWLGWVAISLCLNKLLLLYPDRPRAVLAAHKKFILARVSEGLMLAAFTLLFLEYNTLFINELLNKVSYERTGSALELAAACFIAIAALVKCAQLPTHGWLINVVEAPTPVSALLHAGVINLGGYLLLTFAPLIAANSAAQWIVVVGAGLSVFFSALIMTTRVSIKVRLAWSTSSQMGLMLIECALGLYAMALVHLIAHSLYKAYAFLNSGSAVYEHLEKDIAAFRSPKVSDWVNAAFISILLVMSCIFLSNYSGPASPWIIVAIAIMSFLAIRTANANQTQYYLFIGVCVALAASYTFAEATLQHTVFQSFPKAIDAFSGTDIFFSSVLVLLFLTHAALQHFDKNRISKRIKNALFAGLYLDEWLTKITLVLLPVKLREPQAKGAHQTDTISLSGRAK